MTLGGKREPGSCQLISVHKIMLALFFCAFMYKFGNLSAQVSRYKGQSTLCDLKIRSSRDQD